MPKVNSTLFELFPENITFGTTSDIPVCKLHFVFQIIHTITQDQKQKVFFATRTMNAHLQLQSHNAHYARTILLHKLQTDIAQ